MSISIFRKLGSQRRFAYNTEHLLHNFPGDEQCTPPHSSDIEHGATLHNLNTVRVQEVIPAVGMYSYSVGGGGELVRIDSLLFGYVSFVFCLFLFGCRSYLSPNDIL